MSLPVMAARELSKMAPIALAGSVEAGAVQTVMSAATTA